MVRDGDPTVALRQRASEYPDVDRHTPKGTFERPECRYRTFKCYYFALDERLLVKQPATSGKAFQFQGIEGSPDHP